MRVALVAEEAAGAQALRRVLASDHEVAVVLTSQTTGAGPAGVAGSARDASLRVEGAGRVRDPAFAAELRRLEVDVLLNVHSMHLIDTAVLAAPRFGAFNLHPAPLPEFAGVNTVSWAIYERAAEYGSTLHWLTSRIDAGGIAYAARFAMDDEVSAARLMSRSVREGMMLLDRLLAQLTSDPRGVPAVAQDLRRRRYFSRGIPHGGRIEWASDSRDIHAFVRACDYEPFESPWGAPKASIAGIEAEIVRTALTGELAATPPGTVRVTGEGELHIAARDEWIRVLRVRFSGTSMSGESFAAASSLPTPS
jgi:methionyl-tRNA formyltransferase